MTFTRSVYFWFPGFGPALSQLQRQSGHINTATPISTSTMPAQPVKFAPDRPLLYS
jgi:hypothetical protein